MPRTIENIIAKREYTGTTSGTPGTRTNVAHGLNQTPNIRRTKIVSHGPAASGDNDTNNGGACEVVASDATNFVVKGNAVSLRFTLTYFGEDADGQTMETFPAAP